MAVPPFGHFREAMLIVPGHMMPTEKPHSAHPASPTAGKSAKDAVR